MTNLLIIQHPAADRYQQAPLNPEINIGTLADQCVKCGLCLPHCPTYRLFHNEADSPRGRIALMQGLEHGDLEADSSLFRHLDRCLGCRSCEKSCPSGVHYSLLLDTTRDRLEKQGPRPFLYRQLRRLGLYLAAHPSAWRRSWAMLRFYQRSGLQALLRFSGLLRLTGLDRFDRQLPVIQRIPAPASDNTTASDRPRIGLFTGCMEAVVSATLIDDTQTLLRALGYQVMIPEGQTCCGALHQHNGASASARTLKQRNQATFIEQQIDTALYLSSGCSSTLTHNSDPHSTAMTADPQPEFVEAIQFIAAQPGLSSLTFAPLAETVAWFTPCSQRNITAGEPATRRLLEHIPGIDLRPLAGDCCGAAGTYMLTQPDTATRLRADVLDGMPASTTRYLVTANVGCAIHLTNGLRQHKPAIEVLHPLTLLCRQLLSTDKRSE